MNYDCGNHPGQDLNSAPLYATRRDFLNSVGTLAEEEGHHPDFHLTNYRNVRIELSTHAIGGLSMPDMVLAAKIDAIPCEYSPKWLRESPAGAIIAAEAAKRQKSD